MAVMMIDDGVVDGDDAKQALPRMSLISNQHRIPANIPAAFFGGIRMLMMVNAAKQALPRLHPMVP